MRKTIKNNEKEKDLLSIGKTHCKKKEYENAIKTLSKFVKLNSNNAEGWYYLGRSYNEIDKYDKAIECLLKSVKLNFKY